MAAGESRTGRQHRKIGNSKKWKFSFFRQRRALSMSFEIFLVSYRVTNFLLKLVDKLLFSTEKTEFPFWVFPYFRVMRDRKRLLRFVHTQTRTLTLNVASDLGVWCVYTLRYSVFSKQCEHCTVSLFLHLQPLTKSAKMEICLGPGGGVQVCAMGIGEAL